MTLYVLTSRCGTEMGETLCSMYQPELYVKMKAEYDDVLKNLEKNSRVEYASYGESGASIVTGGDAWEWNISKHDLRPQVTPGQYMGSPLDFSLLIGKEDLLRRLEGGGANYPALEEIRDEYSERFGRDLVWNYMLDDDLHTGFMLIPVKEGFLSLPYDEVLENTFEQYLLEEARLLDQESLEYSINSWQQYSNGLLQAMEEAKELIEGGKKGE